MSHKCYHKHLEYKHLEYEHLDNSRQAGKVIMQMQWRPEDMHVIGGHRNACCTLVPMLHKWYNSFSMVTWMTADRQAS